MKVGLIGLGNMGAGMAANLLKAGHEVTVYNRTPGKAQALVAQGARQAAKVADACRGEAVITMLADDSAVESVVFGQGGIGVQPGQRCDSHFLEHNQRRAFRKNGSGARDQRPAFYLSPRIWTARGGGCGHALCRRGGRAGCDRRMHAPV